jgi:hypothetical protein
LNKIKLLVILAVLVEEIIGFTLYSHYSPAISLNVGSDVSKSLIDADIGLLGLFGIVAVYVLTTYQSLERMTEERIARIHSEHEIRSRIGYSNPLPYKVAEKNVSGAEEEYQIFKTKSEKLEKLLTRIQTSSQDAVGYVVAAAFLFLTSMLLALGVIGEIGNNTLILFIYNSIVLCVDGAAFIIILIYELGTTSSVKNIV